MESIGYVGIYHASTQTLQKRGIDVPDVALSVEEQRSRAQQVLADLDASRPKPTGLIDGLVALLVPAREDPVDVAFRYLVELLAKYGVGAFHRGGRGAGCGPLADCATQLVAAVMAPVAASGGRQAMSRVFGKLEDHCRASYDFQTHWFIVKSLDWACDGIAGWQS